LEKPEVIPTLGHVRKKRGGKENRIRKFAGSSGGNWKTISETGKEGILLQLHPLSSETHLSVRKRKRGGWEGKRLIEPLLKRGALTGLRRHLVTKGGAQIAFLV